MGHTLIWTSLVGFLDLCMPCIIILTIRLATKHAQHCCRGRRRAAMQSKTSLAFSTACEL